MASSLFIPLLLLLLSPFLLASGRNPAADPELRSRKLAVSDEDSSPSFRRQILVANTSTASSPGPRHRPWIWVAGFVGGAATGIFSGVIFSLFFRLLFNCLGGHYRPQTAPSIFSPLIKPEDLALFTNDDDFPAMELVGRGGSGEVFLAHLPSGKPLAVKKISVPLPSENPKKLRQISSEIATVGHVRHRNLLPLLAHVPRKDAHLLIYDYMKNGTLHDALGDLDWAARRIIAAGVAAGLEYLHQQHSPRIIHRDLKPANILLDDNMEARIADFGLAAALPDAQTHQTASNLAGTIGFIAPEYHQTLRFTEKCDIYSFGVVLAVMVLGKMPSDPFFQDTEELSLVNWLRNACREGREEEAMDESLRGNGCEDQMALVLKVALLCTVEDPKQRPTSKEVRCMLAQISKPLASST